MALPNLGGEFAFLSGTLLLPLEVRELFRGVTLLRCSLLVGNLAVVLYMLYIILANRRERRRAAPLRLAQTPRQQPDWSLPPLAS